MMRPQYIVLSALLCLVAGAALAQTPVRVRGAVEALDGNVLTVKSRDGGDVAIKLADNYAVASVVPIELAAIKPGSFIGTAAMTQSDGNLVALEVLVFPEAMRGTGEGHYPWDLQPESTMTNATVATLADTPKGRELSLTFKGGTNMVTVPKGAPIVTFEPGDKSMLKPGAKIFAVTQKQPDGSLTAARVNVGKNGLTPPM
ncbi:MAG TPA: hypothetical protein VMB81_14650 [Candidatus Sulfotelmatobacter sp.]|nr:hypothetical protein [Candidatus Sulfotelmatobacter sp.]